MIKFKITKVQQSIFGQFEAILLSDRELKLDVDNSPGNFTLRLNQGDNFTLDFMTQSDKYAVGEIIETPDYVLSSYAKNPQKGMVIIVTKSVRKATIQAI